MAVGVTLNQLYAPPSATSGSVPSPSTALTPPQGRSPTSIEDAKPTAVMQQMDRIYQMPYSTQQQQQYLPQNPQSTTSYGMQYQPLTKPGSFTSEDYAADPLPFEYSRKYLPPHREDVTTGLRGSSPNIVVSSYNDTYGSQPIYTPISSFGQRLNTYGQYVEPRGYPQQPELATQVPQPHFPRLMETPMYNSMSSSMLPHNSFPTLLDAHAMVTKKEVDTDQQQPQTLMHEDVRAIPSTGTAQEAMIKVKTPLKLKYWRNGRRNLQCFPSCKVFGDYSAIKIEDLKQHDFMWGKCRGSLVTEVTLNSNMAFDDLVLLGRVHSLENIPVAFEEAVIRECMLGRTIEINKMDSMKDQWITGERLPDFVQQDGNVACFEFKPKVWKYNEDMTQGKCKRRNVKYYVQFEAFVQMVAGDRRYYACIGSGMSTSFEVGSSRVLARQKRKAATSAVEAVNTSSQSGMTSMQSQQLMTHNGNPLMHNVMTTHPLYAPTPAYHNDGQSRGLPSAFPQVMMLSQPEMHYPMQQQQNSSSQQQQLPSSQQQQLTQSSSSQPLLGEKRKMSSERPAFPTDRSAKMLKAMSGVPQPI
ncbi:unnamed protein product [Peronospora effusa]|uniref:Uncharacterized protein n=1 Tax=Peronospora effusa TaxID=542832 RepID=A0A3M6V759_9STRA|nr:hypothetical protein DD238_008287 [Peronospora effusa]RQM11203.1 hypothetical protein DD237_008351 [Peronospora effusa]CAI5716511.1 unnamed protein product [Peronospora effusa]